jgi:hypothetical protein
MTKRSRASHLFASRALALSAALALMVVALGCSTESQGSDPWVYGPTLDPGIATPSESLVPSGSSPVGSGAPVASVGPGTSQAPQPSSAP